MGSEVDNKRQEGHPRTNHGGKEVSHGERWDGMRIHYVALRAR